MHTFFLPENCTKGGREKDQNNLAFAMSIYFKRAIMNTIYCHFGPTTYTFEVLFFP